MSIAKATDTANNHAVFIEELKKWVQTIDAIIDPLILVDKDYKIVRSNTAMAKKSGMEVTDVVGKTCYEVFANRNTPCQNCALQKAITTNQSQDWELKVGKRHYEVRSQPFKTSSKETSSTVQIYYDRTVIKDLQDKIVQQEKLASIGLLSSGVAHEINNPLGGILAFSQILLKELDKDSPHYKDVEEIEAATQRCKSIVTSLLDFAKNRGAVEEDNKASVSVKSSLQAAMKFAKVSFAKDIKIIEDCVDEELTIFGDRNKLIQVFLNLIQNAIYAMEQGGTLTLQTKIHVEEVDKKRYAKVLISDTGIGIPAEHIKRIFEPFFTTKQPGDGTGLGLSICYGIIKDLHGSLEVDSVLNEGSTFTLKLPLVEKTKLRLS